MDAYELTFRINAPGNLVVDPGPGLSPSPGTVKPGTFVNPALKGAIMRRGVEGEEPGEATAEPKPEPGPPEGGTPPPAAP